MRGRKDPEGPAPKIEGERGLPAKERLDPDSPLRLAVAAAIAFPDGTMIAKGLRREAKRGRLVIERVAGKDYTTLAAIVRMREACRLSFAPPAPRIVLSERSRPDIERAQRAALQTLTEQLARFSSRSRPTKGKKNAGSKRERAGDPNRCVPMYDSS
jgi:hypothetical protein